ncbi:MAG: haloacid dehalogenase-like hydrolase [Alphaproteobacteria bacterium]|nr:haloacid dehalogenase-like hydrolase [Alphaproteobacteria bacterium]
MRVMRVMGVVKPMTELRPLVLDLDGTLIRTDTFHEMMVHLLVTKPWVLLRLPFWFLKGRAFAKARLAEQSDFFPQHLPYNVHLLEFAQGEAQKGRPLILATGTDQKVAEKIAQHLGIFQEVIGSDGHINMTGPHKQKALLDRFEAQGFDYAGDSLVDTHIWQVSQKALVVHPKWGVLAQVQKMKEPGDIHSFPREKHRFAALLLALRPFFWLCNLMAPSGILLLALSLFSSGLLMAGDLYSLHKERTGSFKKSVFAEGHLHLMTALTLTPLLILSGFFLISYILPWGAILSLVYLLSFFCLDRLTRSFSQGFRWIFMGFFQICTASIISLISQ